MRESKCDEEQERKFSQGFYAWLIFLQSEKFRHASKVTTKLASLASEATGKSFKSRISLLESIVTAWGASEEVALNGTVVILLH